MKKAFKIIGISTLILILFRGPIYRLLIAYEEIGTRTKTELTNQRLIDAIDLKSKGRLIELKEIAAIANSITNKELSFTTKEASNNPNELMNTKLANCVGYSSMFNSIANYLIEKNNLQQKIKAKHKIGQLHLFGINLHQFFESPFFRDHDFNEIVHLKTKETILVDPSISDYLAIDSVSSK